MTERWVSAHLFHHGGLDAVIRGVVAPLVDDLTGDGAVDRWFFLRYWEGGEHVRLRLRCSGAGSGPQVRAAVAASAGAWFAAHPSTAPMTPDAYRAFAATVAQGERRASFDDRLRTTDAVEFHPYVPEVDAYGEATSLRAAEEHFAESSALALAVLRSGADAGRRAAVALAALTVTLACCEPDPDAAAARLAEPLPVVGLPPLVAAAPDRAAALYDAQREGLRRQTGQLWRGEGGGQLVTAWRRSVERLRAVLDAEHAAGRCDPTDPLSPHAHLARAAPEGRRVVPTILLRCTHLFHNRLGLGPAAELTTSMLLARAVRDLPAPLPR